MKISFKVTSPTAVRSDKENSRKKNQTAETALSRKEFTTQTALNTANSLGYCSDTFTRGDTPEKENSGKKQLQRVSEHTLMPATFCVKNVDTSTQQNF